MEVKFEGLDKPLSFTETIPSLSALHDITMKKVMETLKSIGYPECTIEITITKDRGDYKITTIKK